MKIILLFVLLLSQSSFGQKKILNKVYFKKFLTTDTTRRLLIIGENHASAVSSLVYSDLVKYLNRKSGLKTLLVEFGPSEAYFYNKYLETGNEKHLNYTLYAGAIKEWRDAWRNIYQYNRKLKHSIEVQGIDFDRTRTMAYALYSIFKGYDKRPDFVDDLMEEIKGDSFYSTYTIGYPTKKDILWKKKTNDLLNSNMSELKRLLSEKDFNVVESILENRAVGKGEEREAAIMDNLKRVIQNSEQQDFLLLIGRNHAYLNPVYGDRYSLAQRLADSSAIKILTGSFLYENTEMHVKKGDPIRLFEINRKSPWKRYYDNLNKLAKRDITVIPFRKDLWPLMHYSDFVIVARNQKAYELLNKPVSK